ncbi:peptidoglycan-recognition protein 1-like isoform X2 [Harmonia axyridis]|uniref:peptidoglycan-recognition protein 1-like isoform X2 n=1 Tax=Harmonia axyridis TaxID=115357 RepID=UPI001E278634|nr:peptidoglycan-recognition protein 1-like isoform X2 [Harmonia axyridis]
MYSSSQPSSTCRICMDKYQQIINGCATETTPLIFRRRERRKRCTDRYEYLFLGILIFILFSGMTIGFYLLMVEKREIEPAHVVLLADRENWDAADVENHEYLNVPSKKLILVFTNTPNCYDQPNCTKEVHKMQEESLRNNKTDIPYNFLLAEDTRIYEGRGWKYAPDISPYSDNSTLAFAFLGIPGKTDVSALEEQLFVLINLSISHHKLKRCFRVLTRPEESPHLKEITDRIQSTFWNTKCR